MSSRCLVVTCNSLPLAQVHFFLFLEFNFIKSPIKIVLLSNFSLLFWKLLSKCSNSFMSFWDYIWMILASSWLWSIYDIQMVDYDVSLTWIIDGKWAGTCDVWWPLDASLINLVWLNLPYNQVKFIQELLDEYLQRRGLLWRSFWHPLELKIMRLWRLL